MDISKITIHFGTTIIDALRKLNEIRDVSRLILFVLDDNDKVVGSLTDGDIRRALIAKSDLNTKLDKIANSNFLFEYEWETLSNLSKYRKKNIRILPILDKNNRLVRAIDLDKYQALLPMDCMIMAGGRGKRLSPLTDKKPKPMLMLGDKPIIEHNIDRLISFGIKKFYISLKYLGEQIEDYFGDGSEKGVEIHYIWEEEPLGTAGALSLVPEFSTDKILLMNSDLFTNIDFENLYSNFIKYDADMVVASTEYKVDIPYAVFETKGSSVVNFQEKPSYVYQSNAGIYILSRELVKEIPKGKFFDITDLMEKVVSSGRKLIYSPILGYWIDIGKPIDFKRAEEFIKHLN